ncbi:uncharacterized protein PHALS_06349 [Plasmopara halstedii]|uniref:Uncharacterized protein n=1 Tax=Plasmopara halstedii TaxID=4781 RepID=A0A0N7L805_PLAHL|nr:uncharacterized protein PHALS_06349 [Plasmopara halstedii]CEG48531.1 hypothetical protein PHALS_06349 [Plasmopara halstedii]|eukprot:XP_024584900.1 hypothetical protein PHALS_06349 [Plasmopara halstedii]
MAAEWSAFGASRCMIAWADLHVYHDEISNKIEYQVDRSILAYLRSVSRLSLQSVLT